MNDYFIENKDLINTVLENNTELDGDLFFETSLKIRGKFKGLITTSGLLVIDNGAEVIADIKAKNVLLKGTLHGNIIASDRIEIESTGKLYGDIKTFKLKIADNVLFEGNCEMLSQEELLELTEPSSKKENQGAKQNPANGSKNQVKKS